MTSKIVTTDSGRTDQTLPDYYRAAKMRLAKRNAS
jgi:hypothetical protein